MSDAALFLIYNKDCFLSHEDHTRQRTLRIVTEQQEEENRGNCVNQHLAQTFQFLLVKLADGFKQ